MEIDRCASDAVGVVAGVTLGRRRLKWVDYGKMAATFVDLATGKAVRLAPRKEVPHAGREDDPLVFWKDWTDEDLFSCTPVTIEIPLQDLPGPSGPQRRVRRAAARRSRTAATSRWRARLSAAPARATPTIEVMSADALAGRTGLGPGPLRGEHTPQPLEGAELEGLHRSLRLAHHLRRLRAPTG